LRIALNAMIDSNTVDKTPSNSSHFQSMADLESLTVRQRAILSFQMLLCFVALELYQILVLKALMLKMFSISHSPELR